MYKIFKIWWNSQQVGNATNVCQASRFEKEKRKLEMYGFRVIENEAQEGGKKNEK